MPVSAKSLQSPEPPRARDDWLTPMADAALPQIVQAIGARVWSADGAEYVDFDNAGGAVLLGHRDPAVIAAVRMARSADDRRGPMRYWSDLSNLILAMMPGSQGHGVAFVADVTQVLRAALTASRRLIGRDLRLRLPQPRWRCTADGAATADLPVRRPAGAGISARPASATPPPPWCSIPGRAATLSAYLAGVRALADRHGAVLIFDETLSGFRVHEGGAQAFYGVQADLAVFGQSLANGMPLGALGWLRDLVHAAREGEHLGPDIASLAAAKAVLTTIAAKPVIAVCASAGPRFRPRSAG